MEEETRRSGLDRREQLTDVPDDRRKGTERRAAVRNFDRIVEFMKKIPVFSGLTNDQYMKILRICSHKEFPEDDFIYRRGDEPNELFILLKGRLRVLTREDTLLTQLTPIALVGAIGVFSGTCHLNSVSTITESSLIRIHKIEIFRLFENDHILGNQIFQNAISSLAQNLEVYNEIIQEMQVRKPTIIF